MQILFVLFLGGLVGTSGRYLFEHRLPGDEVILALIGVVGAAVGTGLVSSLEPSGVIRMLVGTLGAMTMVALYRVTSPKLDTNRR